MNEEEKGQQAGASVVVEDTAAIIDGKSVINFSHTEAQLARLETEFKAEDYDVTTAAGMKDAKEIRRQIVALRTRCEAKRKELKQPALDFGKALDEAAKSVIQRITRVEIPFDVRIEAQLKIEADAKSARDSAEKLRIADIEAQIKWIRELPGRCSRLTAAELDKHITDLGRWEYDFQEMAPSAAEDIKATIETLQMMASAQRNAVELAELRAAGELETKRRKALADIERTVSVVAGMDANFIRQAIAAVQAPTEAAFGPLLGEAVAATASTTEALAAMLAQAVESEAAVATQRAAEAEEAAKAARARAVEGEKDRALRKAAPRMLAALIRVRVCPGWDGLGAETKAAVDAAIKETTNV